MRKEGSEGRREGGAAWHRQSCDEGMEREKRDRRIHQWCLWILILSHMTKVEMRFWVFKWACSAQLTYRLRILPQP